MQSVEHVSPRSPPDLSDLIRRQTGCAAYLDSNDLVDLRTLFNEGDSLTLKHMQTRTNTGKRTLHYAHAHAFVCTRAHKHNEGE